jgi:hypothetical protein
MGLSRARLTDRVHRRVGELRALVRIHVHAADERRRPKKDEEQWGELKMTFHNDNDSEREALRPASTTTRLRSGNAPSVFSYAKLSRALGGKTRRTFT